MSQVVLGTGRRKTSVARVMLSEGTGEFANNPLELISEDETNGNEVEHLKSQLTIIDEENATFNGSRSEGIGKFRNNPLTCLLYTSPSPRDLSTSRMPSSA